MLDDDQVCLCFRVSKRKIVNYCRREKPPVASLISECLAAGTGCGWCVPFLRVLHQQAADGVTEPDLPFTPAEYAKRRKSFHETGERDMAPEVEGADGSAERGPDGGSST